MRVVLAATALLVGLVIPGATSARSHACTAIVVHGSIQKAVDAAQPCDWVLVPPGVYRESVTVTTPRLHIRGMNRNRVILDGGHRAGDGLLIRADGVRVENLTVRNFDRMSLNGEHGNEIWWNGGDESGLVGMHGWWGSYLTTYDTGLLGGYGIFVSNAESGALDHVYASGFSDAGIYVGACRDCNATVSHALSERNGLGYSNANAGGHLVIQDSVFRNNSVGLAFASEACCDPPPPQLGACDGGANTLPTPPVPSTQIARCTIVRRNFIVGNNNLSSPADSAIKQLPWGVGIELAGAYGDLVTNNVIRDNPQFGILVHEYPDPFPATPKTIYFQISGNKIAANTIRGSKLADLAFEGGLFGAQQSFNNCVAGNRLGRSLPADLTPWSCTNATTPNIDDATSHQVVYDLLKLQTQSGRRVSKPQPAPTAQPTMPQPCAGTPPNSLCKR